MKLVRKKTFVLALLALTFVAAPVRAQQDAVPKNVADSVGDALHYTADQFLSIAEAMPADQYGYLPTAPGGNFTGTRSFGEQVKHVACANFAFFNEMEGKKPPESCEKGGPSPAKTKVELVKYLKDSFEYGNKVCATLNLKNEMDQVDGQYGAPNTKLGVAVIAVWHIADHYGQIVEYLRLNGIVPPPTKEAGLQVR
jgi:DinB superfamily